LLCFLAMPGYSVVHCALAIVTDSPGPVFSVENREADDA
jgi:hypothetical protein